MGTYTKTGDDGTTSVLGGGRISKNDIRIHLVGTLDELNSHLGLVKAKISDTGDKKFIEIIQNNLMKLMAYCSCGTNASDASSEKYLFTENEVAELESEIDMLQDFLPRQFTLVLPGKNETEALIHIARTVARRAERYFFGVNGAGGGKPLNHFAGVYLNRLSDYLFALSYKN